MRAIPFFDLIILPGVSCNFQGDYFEELAGAGVTKGEEVIFVMLREDKDRSKLKPEDFYPIGMYCVVEEVSQDGEVSVNAVKRVDVTEIETDETGISHFHIESRAQTEDMKQEEMDERFGKVRTAYLRYLAGTQFGMMARGYMMQWKNIDEMVTGLSPRLPLLNEEKYMIMAEDSVQTRFEMVEKALYQMLELMKVGGEAEDAQTASNEKLYREDALRKQIEFLQNELDAMHPESVSAERTFAKKIAESGMNETARKEAEKVLGRLKTEGKSGPEYGLLTDYLEFVTALPWEREPLPEIDLKKAQEVLDQDHFGMKKVKERIIQQMAVMALNKKVSGSILLFVGAPGTGKTSIGASIAQALGRKYVRVSLGGVRDEAEIRGHRRTYIGAMPGRIMDGIRKCGANNPVMVLDEVDKLARDFSGDPASALLEVLDPEQNATFTDHYMNVPYDLSNVIFVCTANTVDTIPEPLLNRMEVIEFPGYTAVEKVQIARRHLLPKAMADTGLKAKNLKLTDGALEHIISDYTAESGVRGLKKRLSTLCRVAAVKLVRGEQKSVTVSKKKLREFLDMRPIQHDSVSEVKNPGIVTGLAWTAAGGEILFVEALFTKGSGKLLITGQLGDVMKESVQIALSLVKARYPEKAELFEKNDLHIHVPEGAVPKDGPSAGVTLTTAISSLVTGKRVEGTIGMTGEVSLRGLVLPIGGLPEKLMAATRAGVKTVLIPQGNAEDLEDVAKEIRDQLEIIPVRSVDDVLKQTGIVEST